MDNQYMVAENIVELILNNATQCSDKEVVLDEIRRVLGQIKSHKLNNLIRNWDCSKRYRTSHTNALLKLFVTLSV